MKRTRLNIIHLVCFTALLITAIAASAETFNYLPPGNLIPGSGTGRVDYKVYFPGLRFPIEKAPAYANSQVYGVGGQYGPGGSECHEDNYSYPWRDNFCEKRDWNTSWCPTGKGHQGQDIRPRTCEDSKHWAVAAEGGTFTDTSGKVWYMMGDSNMRHTYMHLNPSGKKVWVGKRVEAGDKVGLISDYGQPTTYHLHYEMYSAGHFFPPYMSLVRAYENLLGIGDSVKRAATARGADFNGDGKDDIFWYAAGSTSDHIWSGKGRNTWTYYHDINIYGTYVPIIGDFNADGNSDIFWYAAGNAADWIYYGQDIIGEFRVVSKSVQGTYIPICGDFNGDRRSDIFWYGPGAGRDALWMATATGFKYYPVQIWGYYAPVVGDFNGDYKDDIFWYAAGDAADWIYYGTWNPGNGFDIVKSKVQGTYIPISGDFNGDKRSDILWYGPGPTRPDALWMAYGAGFKYYAITVNGYYRPVKGNFDGDGYTDIFWYGVGDTYDYMWFGRGDSTFIGMQPRQVNGVYLPLP